MSSRRDSEKEAHKRIGTLFSVSLVSGVALIFGAQALVRSALSSPHFIVQQIEAVWPEENRRPTERFRLRPPTSIFHIDLAGVSQALQQHHPSAEVDSVRRILPNRLVATMRFKRAILQVRTDRFYPISEEGVVMVAGQSSPWPDLPILYVEGARSPLRVGASLHHPAFEWTSELLGVIRKQGGVAGHWASSIRCRGEEIILFLDSGLEIRFMHSRFWPAWQQLTELVAQKPRILDGARYVDLRFEDPVIGTGTEKGKGKR